MKAAKFKTRNTLYEINSEGIYRDGVLEIEAIQVQTHTYHGGALGLGQEPSEGAKLLVTYTDKEDSELMSMHTTRIIEVFPAA